MKRKNLLLFIALVFSTASFSQKNDSPSLNLQYFLKQLYDFSLLPAYEQNTHCAQVSTYDRTGMNNDGFNGTYSFIRRNADSTLVIFEQKGPGVINRFWTPTPTEDTLDFYIDDSLHKAFSLSYMDLYSGKVYPFVPPLCANQLGGFYCYLPIPFNTYCKIVLQAKTTRFHQIGYKLYPAGTSIKNFSLPLSKEEEEALAKLKAAWDNADAGIKSNSAEFKKQFILQPGKTTVLYESFKPARITGFEIVSQAPLDTIAKAIDLRITWDGERQPAVYCPLADYFGYAFAKASMQGLMAGCDGKKHYSRFPMPFDRSAKLELIYRNVPTADPLKDISLLTRVYVQENKRNPATEGKFYAAWSRENPVPAGKPYHMLDVKGKGHFAGVALQAQGLRPGITQFFEGDDSTVIDGGLRFHGTGSEDFFNGGWYALLDCWDDAMSLPLSGSLDYSIPLARTGGYRFFLSDKMSFNTSLLQTIEHGPEFNRFPSDYTSVSYYYCDRNNAPQILPSNANTGIYIPDTLEVYPQLTPAAVDENISVAARWNGSPAKTMFYTIGNASLLKMHLQDIPPGRYSVHLDYQRSNTAATFSLWQRQTQVSAWINAYAVQDERIAMQKVADVDITSLNNSLSFRFRVTGERTNFTLTRIILVKNKAE